MTAIRENGATSGAGVLAIYLHDNFGRRDSVTRGNGTTTNYSYDAVSRLASFSQDLGGSAYDFTHGFTYNPAGQIASLTRNNDTYAWAGHYNVDRLYGVNGLNQMTTAGLPASAMTGAAISPVPAAQATAILPRTGWPPARAQRWRTSLGEVAANI